ncbi:MAG: hypothetical protein ACFFDN_45420 [Candidatus Hodarchaeota archaeon]
MRKLIYIIGVDGSGKTTLAKGLVSHFNKKGFNLCYLYARHFPILLFPFKIISKILLYQKHSEFQNYHKYSEIKGNFSNRHRIIARLYAFIWVIDYLIISFFPVHWKLIRHQNIIVDRYIGDVVVNISVASKLRLKEEKYLLKLFHLFFPKPHQSFFINVNEEVAFKRKNDIQSIEYLKKRKQKYFDIQPFYRFEVVDGNKSKDALKHLVAKKIQL